MRVQAIRASETLYKAGDKSFDADYRRLVKDADTRGRDPGDADAELVQSARHAKRSITSAQGVKQSARRAGDRQPHPAAGRPTRSAAAAGAAARCRRSSRTLLQQGGAIYSELCFCVPRSGRQGHAGRRCAGRNDEGAAARRFSPRAGSLQYVVQTVMHGLTGPVDGNTYTDVMVPMGTNNDEWIAAIASYVRNSMGNTGTIVSPADVARVRAASAGRKTAWTVAELEATLPRPLAVQPTWTATASHNVQMAAGVLGSGTWSTGVPQQAGMWFQIELPAVTPISEVQFDSPGAAAGRKGRPRPRRCSNSRCYRNGDASNWRPSGPDRRSSHRISGSSCARSHRSSADSGTRSPGTGGGARVRRRTGLCSASSGIPARLHRGGFV